MLFFQGILMSLCIPGIVCVISDSWMEATYSANSTMTFQLSKYLMATEITRSRVWCGQKCLALNCIGYQYNKTSGKCMLYSASLGQPASPAPTLALYSKRNVIFGNQPGCCVYQDDWLVFVRRLDGSVDFQRPWADYRDGFGDPCGEFWLGLESMHNLTSSAPYKLRIEMRDWAEGDYFAEYSSFQVQSESTAYKLSVSGYDGSSTAANSMIVTNGYKFSTIDVDNDGRMPSPSCAEDWTGGWWYDLCTDAHPTGTYHHIETLDKTGVGYRTSGLHWSYSFKYMSMMIKP